MNKTHRSFAVILPVLCVALGWGVNASAEDKTYVLIPSIPGESTDAAHANWIDAYALDAGATYTGASTNFADVAILKGTDKATPLLNDAIARALMFATLTVEVCRATSPQQCYYKVELSNALTSSIALSGSSCVGGGACTPSQTESVSFKYTRIKWTYTPWTGGSAGTPITKCFDLPSRTAC